MITFIEYGDIDKTVEKACGEIDEEIAYYAKKQQTFLDTAHWMVMGLYSAKKMMLLCFATEGLMSGSVFHRLSDKTVEQIVKEAAVA